jgi:membrane-associated phospholipid phosphatase
MTGAVVDRGVSDYCRQLATFAMFSLARLVRTPEHSRRTIALRRLSRQGLFLIAGCGGTIIVLMAVVDVFAINHMPPRGAPQLWLVRIFTDFAKSEYVLLSLGMSLLVIAAIAPLLTGMRRATLGAFALRVQFLFLAVAVPNLIGEAIKGIVGRGRPFVGGSADAFNYSPLVWTEQFASFPSGHAITSFALTFALAAVWPRSRYVMIVYALLIAVSRVLLLAHHPSDVLVGALIGLLGALFVRQWFAVRRLGFVIRGDGSIVSSPGPSCASLKGVAARTFAP